MSKRYYGFGNSYQADDIWENVTVYSSLGAFVDWVESLPRCKGVDDCDAGHHTSTWRGGFNLAQAKHAARFGWPEGTRKASALVDRIATRVLDRSHIALSETIGYDVIGAAYDAGAVALGIPEAWGVMQPQESKRAVRIVVNIMASSGVDAGDLLTRGIAVTALVLALQAKGYPVTVDVFHAVREDKGGSEIIRLADAASGSQLDVDRMTYALAHPSMLRSLCRTGTARSTGSIAKWDAGRVWSNVRPPGDIDLFIGGAHLHEVEHWRDGGEDWVLQEYERQTA